jgi:hypothetical protein
LCSISVRICTTRSLPNSRSKYGCNIPSPLSFSVGYVPD